MTKKSFYAIALLNVTVSLPGLSAAFSTSPLVPVRYSAGTRRSSVPLFGVCVASSLDLDCECDVKADDEEPGAIARRTRKKKYVERDRHSARNWLYNMRTLPQSSVLRNIRSPVLAVVSWATIVSATHRLLIVTGKVGIAKKLCISSAPHSFLVNALGLLLVFRTNSAYQRFVEGRAIWERIQSTSRNLSRFMFLYEQEIGKARVQRLQHLLAAFPYLLRHHIRPRCTGTNITELQKSGNGLLLNKEPFYPVETRYEEDKEARENVSSEPKVNCWVDKRSLPWSLLPNYILDRIATSINRPLWVCDHMATEVASLSFTGKWTNRERLQYFDKVEKLTNAIGECERIQHTAVPLNYARHSLRSLTLWLFTLPFALIKDLGFLTGPAMGIVAWLLFGVYEIGYYIEDPFLGSLRLSTLCHNIRRDVLGIGGEGVPYSAYSLPVYDDTDVVSDWEKIHDEAHMNFMKTVAEASVQIKHPAITNSTILPVHAGNNVIWGRNVSNEGPWM